MNSEYCSLLYSVFWHRIIFIFIVAFVGTILNIVYLRRIKQKSIMSRAGRRRQRIRDYEKRRRDCLSIAILGYIGCIAGILFWALPPCLDAVNESIVTSDAVYDRDNIDLRTGMPNIGGNIQITVENKTFTLELYPGFDEKDFPTGEYAVKAYYGKNSKILLDIEIQSSDCP